MQATSSHVVDTLNSLLRGELAATETYQQALEKITDSVLSAQLQQIHVEHREAANELRQHVHQFGGQPEQGSGAWGAFAKATEGVAKVFGQTAALKVLKEGEESGLHTYEKTLQSGDMPAECVQLLQSQLIPQTDAHITILERLMESARNAAAKPTSRS